MNSESRLATRRLALDPEAAFALIGETLALGRSLWVDATGASMYPVIRDGSRVLLAPRVRPVRRGDIVLVRFGHRLILHRVTSVCGECLTLRGDAAAEADPRVTAARTVGVAVACADAVGVRALVPSLRYGVIAVLRQWGVELHRHLRRPWRGLPAAGMSERGSGGEHHHAADS